MCKHCRKVSRNVAALDAWVIGHVVDRLSGDDAAELLADRERIDLAELRDRANALRTRQHELAALFAAGVVTGTQLKTGTALHGTVGRR